MNWCLSLNDWEQVLCFTFMYTNLAVEKESMYKLVSKSSGHIFAKIQIYAKP